MVERWVSVTEAVAELQLSERTIRRQISGGRLVSRTMGGRVEVRIDGGSLSEPADRHTTGTLATGGSLSAEGLQLAVQAITEPVRVELRRARRSAAWGWSLTAAAGIVLAVGAVLGVQAVERSRGRAEAAEGLRAVLADDLARERQRVELVERAAVEQARQAIRAMIAPIPPPPEAALVGVTFP